MSAGFLALHARSNSLLQLTMLLTYQSMSAYDVRVPFYTSLPSMAGPVYLPLLPFTNVINLALHAMSGRGPGPPVTNSIGLFSSATIPMEQAMAKRLTEMEAMIKWIFGVPIPLKKSQLYSYAKSPFVDSFALVEMPKKFSFPNIKLYDDTTDPINHITSYKQYMFITTIP